MSGVATFRPVTSFSATQLDALTKEIQQLTGKSGNANAGQRGKPMNPVKVSVLAALRESIKNSPNSGGILVSLEDMAKIRPMVDGMSDYDWQEAVIKEVQGIVRHAIDEVFPRGTVYDADAQKNRPAPRVTDVKPPIFMRYFDEDGDLVQMHKDESITDYSKRAVKNYPNVRRLVSYCGSHGETEGVAFIWGSK
jgi:hypothetical protein